MTEIEYKQWIKGDPVGRGAYLQMHPALWRQYYKACNDQIVKAAARDIAKLKTKYERRQRISSAPISMQEAIKAELLVIWKERS